MSFDFPSNPTQGQEYQPIPNGLVYVFMNTQWIVKDQDAPNDGKCYGRKNKSWQEVSDTSYPNAPADGKIYARKDNAWWEVATGLSTLTPLANNAQNLGSASLRWATVYTADLSLKNDVGDWTIVEGEDDLFITNNRNGKAYKFALMPVDPAVIPPRKE
jgi:hypothetical protein